MQALRRAAVRAVARSATAATATTTSCIARPLLSFPRVVSRSAFTYPSSRSLDEIVKLPLLIPHTREEVAHIWQAHHDLARNAATTSDTLTSGEYDTFVSNASVAPLFVVPCFRLHADLPAGAPLTFDTEGGFEMMLVNLQQSSLLVTSLEEYKARGAGAATPYAVITLYSDMAASKDLVLVRAEMMDVNVAIPQLQQVWEVIKRCYITSPETFAAHPREFNRKPNPTFDFDAYIADCKAQVKLLQLKQTKHTLMDAEIEEPAAAPAAAATPKVEETAAEFVVQK